VSLGEKIAQRELIQSRRKNVERLAMADERVAQTPRYDEISNPKRGKEDRAERSHANYGLKQIAQDGVGPLSVLAVLGLVVAWLFFCRQQALTDPLIDLALFRDRVFITALAINVLDFFIGFGVFLFIAQYLQLVLGLSPLHAGLWTAP
jgi:hypothetical protein